MPPKICCLATWQIPFRFGYQRYRPHAKPAPAAKAQVWIWYTQPKTNIFPENWWLEDDLPFNIFRFSADMLISRVYISGLCWIRATRATELEAASKFHHVGWQNLKTEHPCQQHASCKGSTLSPTDSTDLHCFFCLYECHWCEDSPGSNAEKNQDHVCHSEGWWRLQLAGLCDVLSVFVSLTSFQVSSVSASHRRHHRQFFGFWLLTLMYEGCMGMLYGWGWGRYGSWIRMDTQWYKMIGTRMMEGNQTRSVKIDDRDMLIGAEWCL